MKSEKEGGRHSYFSDGWCPHLHIGSFRHVAVRVIEVAKSEHEGEIFPGEEGEVVFHLFPTSANFEDPPHSFDEFKEGKCFEIVVGNCIVGTGKVLFAWTES